MLDIIYFTNLTKLSIPKYLLKVGTIHPTSGIKQQKAEMQKKGLRQIVSTPFSV